jgi:hypothetical protein
VAGDTVTIARRFNGPPDLGHGGYSCGVVAVRVDAPVASVSLRLPPPLERPLSVRRGQDGAVSLLDGEAVVADGRPASLDLDVPHPVSVEEAREASKRNPWLDRHPFPTCFGCGPDHPHPTALREILGPVAGRDLMADAWTPHPDLAGEDGAVDPLFVWAALDCPTGTAAIDPHGGPAVLANLTANPTIAPVRAGEPHVVIAWLLGREGRKSRGGAAVFTAGGELCAASEGLWVQLRDPSTHGARV